MGNTTTPNSQTQSAQFTMLYRAIWRDQEWKRLAAHSQWLYLMLITQLDMSACGVLQINERRWLNYAQGLDRDTIDLALRDLCEARFVLADYETGEIWIRSFMKYDRRMHVTSKNGRKFVKKAVDRIESDELRSSVDAEMRRVSREINAAIEAKKLKSEAKAASKHASEAVEEPSNSATNLPTNLGSNNAAIQQYSNTEKQQQQLEPTVTYEMLPDVAAAALQIWIEWRVSVDTTIKSVLGWKRKVRQETINELGAQMIKQVEDDPGVSVNQLCKAHFQMGPADIAAGLRQLRLQGVELPIEVKP